MERTFNAWSPAAATHALRRTGNFLAVCKAAMQAVLRLLAPCMPSYLLSVTA